MKRLAILTGLMLLLLNSCITIIDEPMVTLNPELGFQAHVRGETVYVDVNVNANPAFVNAGNIPTIFDYSGKVEIYNQESGSVLASEDITGDGLNVIIEVSTNSTSYDNLIVIASGKVSAYADEKADGLSDEDVFIHSADFYVVTSLLNLLEIQDYPIVNMNPSVDFQTYMLGKFLYATANISANPTYVNTGSFPILFNYDGLIYIYDEDSGGVIKFKVIEGSGLSAAVTAATDTTTFDGFVIIVDGTITCTGDIESDGDPSNDILISTTDVYEILYVDLRED